MSVRRIQGAANSWLFLNEIYQQFRPSQDGAVERDMRAAEMRLKTAIDETEWAKTE